MSPEAAAARTQDLHRFLTFVDACVAIAVTLLVLPLVDAAASVSDGTSPGTFFDENRGRMAAFLLSFAVIALVWLGHHRYFSMVRSADDMLLRISLGWTLTIVLLPFPTALISPYGSERVLRAAYIGLLLVNSAFMALLCLHVSARPGLWVDGITKVDVSAGRAIARTCTLLTAFVLGVAVPPIGFYALLLRFLPEPTVRQWRLWRARRSGTAYT